jgi:uncharacterized protein (DUF1778 family)
MSVRTSSGRTIVVVMARRTEEHNSRRYRIEVRVTPEQDAVIRRAAELEDTTVTNFVLDTVTARARKVIKSNEDLVLSNEAFDRFLAELDKPAEAVPELVELFKRNPKIPEA